MSSALAGVAVAARPRAFVRVSGPQAGDYLQRMVSNDVLALASGGSCEALLLTPKARVIATLRVVRRADDDFLLLTEPELGEVVRDHLARMRFAARCEVEREEHESYVVIGEGAAPPPNGVAIACDDFGIPALEVLDTTPPDAPQLDDQELERLRIQAGTPRFGREIDDRVLPAEAGLEERAVSFTKGCYPGQEPVARLRYRGHVNRSLRVLRIDAPALPPFDAPIEYGGKSVGRITSAVPVEPGVVALGYVRDEVPIEAAVTVAGAAATMSRPRP
jgi:tRNA-modifying protein YgfZ